MLAHNSSLDRDLLKSLRVLYAEDDEEVREQMAHLLQRWVGELFLAEDGQEGIELFAANHPDIVVTDIQMPRRDGLQLAAEIKRLSPDTPVILTTAFNENRYFMRAIEIGVDHYIAKPVNTRALLEVLNKSGTVLMQHRELARKNAELHAYRVRAEEELALTHHVLQRMIRAEGLKDEKLRYWLQPAEQFNGDTVAAARAPGGDLFVFLADAIGHGLPAAMNLLPLIRVFYRMVEKGFSIPSMVRELNQSTRLHSPRERFVAAAIARVDFRNHLIEAWNGGIPFAAILNGTGTIEHTFISTHPPLGILDDTSLDIGTEIHLTPKDGELVLCSDGILEAQDENGTLFGYDNLAKELTATPRQDRIDGLIAAVRQFIGEASFGDDLSIISVHCG